MFMGRERVMCREGAGYLARVRLARGPVGAVLIVRDPDAGGPQLVALAPFWRVFQLGAVDVPAPRLDETLLPETIPSAFARCRARVKKADLFEVAHPTLRVEQRTVFASQEELLAQVR